MARFLNKASSSSLLRSVAATEEYKNGIFKSSGSQFCNFSSKASAKQKSKSKSGLKEDTALQPALSKSKSKSKTKSGAVILSKPKPNPKTKSGAGTSSKEDIALQQALYKISASFGKGAIMWLGRQDTPRTVPVVSTGSFALDMALGIGGLPKGRVVEVYGPEGSGKTTLALHIIAEARKQGGVIILLLRNNQGRNGVVVKL
ncbi:hypothetical protein MKX01_024582 [Papaver californicum]|nr:hypothetical protein MKX01_024582 [Papaver californicum]